MAQESAGTIRVDLREVQDQLFQVDEDLRNIRLRARMLWSAEIISLLAEAGVGAGAYVYSWFKDAASVGAIAFYAATTAIVCTAGFLAKRITNLSDRRNSLVTRREKLREAKRDRSSALWGDDEHFVGLRQYREDVRGVIDDYRRGADHYRRVHNIFQSIVIAGSILTTSVTSAAGQISAFRWTAPAISLVVGVSASMTGYFKFRERSLNLQQTADAIEHQCNCVDLRISNYRKFVDKSREAFVEFAEIVEHLKDEQRKREQQLEQPSEIGQRTT